MFLTQIIIAVFLGVIGILGIIINRHNIMLILISLEILFLGINLNIIILSVYLNDTCGEVFFLFILTMVGAETAVGLAILIAYYRVRGNIKTIQDAFLKR